MKNEFTKIMAQQSDEDLIRILSVDKQKYNPESIEAAEKEFEKRNLDQSKFEEIKEKNTARKSNQQNVNKNVASSFTRFLNFIVDLICLNIVFLVLVFIFGMFFTINLENEGISTLPGLLLFIASIVLYYSVMEIKFQKTVGKFLTKTKVVKLTGEKPGNSEIIARSFCRLLPFDRISFLLTPNGMHDFLSKTKVVKDQPEQNPIGTTDN